MDLEVIGAGEGRERWPGRRKVQAPEPAGNAPSPESPDPEKEGEEATAMHKRVTLIGTVISVVVMVCGGISGFSTLTSHLAVIDERIDASVRAKEKLTTRFDGLLKRQGDDEKAEHDHYDSLLGHVKTTETDVKWLIRTLRK